MTYQRPGGIRPCADCGQPKGIEGRGLCAPCYWRNHRARTLDRYPRRFIPSADTVEDYEFLARTQGYTRRLAAERMGITLAKLEKAIEREARRLRDAS